MKIQIAGALHEEIFWNQEGWHKKMGSGWRLDLVIPLAKWGLEIHQLIATEYSSRDMSQDLLV